MLVELFLEVFDLLELEGPLLVLSVFLLTVTLLLLLGSLLLELVLRPHHLLALVEHIESLGVRVNRDQSVRVLDVLILHRIVMLLLVVEHLGALGELRCFPGLTVYIADNKDREKD
jgi:hypothetical protein